MDISDVSYPRASLQLLESRIKYLNNSLNTSKIDSKEDLNEKYQKSNHVKKVFIFNGKMKEFMDKTSNLKVINKNMRKNKNTSDKTQQIKLIKSKYFHNEILRKNIHSPLKRRYKLLVANLPNNKRCFINLHNKDFDSIFKYPNNSIRDLNIKKPINDKNNFNLFSKYGKITKSQEIKKDFIPMTKTLHYKLPKNSFICNSKSMFVDRKESIIMNYTNKRKENAKKLINKKTPKFKVIDKKKKYINIITLMKKVSDKSTNLLIDVKKEEIKNKDSLHYSFGRYNAFKETTKRKINY